MSVSQPEEQTLGYADAAQAYWDKGWRGVLPLKRGAKWPPPKGFTGYNGAHCRRIGGLGCLERNPNDVVGVGNAAPA